MAPDHSQKKSARKKMGPDPAGPMRTEPSSDDAHAVVFFKDPRSGACPGREFLNGIPKKVRAKIFAVLVEVAAAPPKRFSGGGYWEAMKQEMAGWHEVRVDGPNRTHYRLFCLVDTTPPGGDKPYLVVVSGAVKPFMTTLSDNEYAKVRELGERYWDSSPRSIV